MAESSFNMAFSAYGCSLEQSTSQENLHSSSDVLLSVRRQFCQILSYIWSIKKKGKSRIIPPDVQYTTHIKMESRLNVPPSTNASRALPQYRVVCRETQSDAVLRLGTRTEKLSTVHTVHSEASLEGMVSELTKKRLRPLRSKYDYKKVWMKRLLVGTVLFLGCVIAMKGFLILQGRWSIRAADQVVLTATLRH